PDTQKKGRKSWTPPPEYHVPGSVYGKASTRQLHSKTPLLSLEVATPENKSIYSMLSSSTCKSASQDVLGRMQLTLHGTRQTHDGASRLVLTISAWSVKTRRAPSRHCRGSRVYGNTTTAMHDDEYTSLPPPPKSQSSNNSLSPRVLPPRPS
ncbi:unnamed protein product, partial [Laminaria digitata]